MTDEADHLRATQRKVFDKTGEISAFLRRYIVDAEVDVAMEELRIAEMALQEQSDALATALQQLSDERQRYRELFDLAPDGYIVTDSGGMVVAMNASTEDMLGMSSVSGTGKPIAVFVAPEERPKMRQFIDTVVKNRAQPSGIAEIETTMDGKAPFPAHIRCRAVVRNDVVTSILWLVRDMSSHKRHEQDLREARARLEADIDARTIELREKINELEAFHDLAVERELKMMDLEKKLAAREEQNQSSGR